MQDKSKQALENILSKKQNIISILEEIKNIYSSTNRRKVSLINIIGEEGSYDYIIKTIQNQVHNLQNKLSFHYIRANEGEIELSGIETNKRHEFYFMPSFSLKLGLLTLGNSLRFQEVDELFHDIEKQFLKEINSSGNGAIIFIENYDKLDSLTQKFINTICNKNNFSRIYENFPIIYIIMSGESKFNVGCVYEIPKLNDDDIKVLAKSYDLDLNEKQVANLLKITNDNYKLIFNILRIKDLSTSQCLQDIITKRINDIARIMKMHNCDELEDICVCGAYFENGFTSNQIKKLYPAYTDEYLLRIFSELSKKGLLDRKYQVFEYSIDEFKSGLKLRKINYEHIYFQMMFNFYTQNYNEDYSARLKFAINLLNYDRSEELINKSIALLTKHIFALIYSRQISNINELETELEKFDSINLPQNIYIVFHKIISNQILPTDVNIGSFAEYPLLIQAEMINLKLNLLEKTYYPTLLINETINDGIELAKQLDVEGIELYELLQLRLTIVSILVNRSTLSSIRVAEIGKFFSTLEKYRKYNIHIYTAYLRYMNRKSALFHSCDRSIEDLKNAIDYFSQQNNIYELFYSYVNLLGMFAVAKRFGKKEYEETLNSIKTLLSENKDATFYKKEKFEHNFYLNEFLKSISTCKDYHEYQHFSEEYLDKNKILYKTSNYNTTKINIASLLCRIDNNKADKFIDKFIQDNMDKRVYDEFYLYYLFDMKCMLKIIEQNWKEAKKYLEKLKSIPMPEFNDCKLHLHKRINAYETLIEHKFVANNLMEYDNIIEKIYKEELYGMDYFQGVDDSWWFYSRGFLLTDTQYFS